MNIAGCVMWHNSSVKASASSSLCTDTGKRTTFVENFTLNGVTSELTESVDATTSAWEEKADELCKHLACGTAQEHKPSASRANTSVVFTNGNCDEIVAPNTTKFPHANGGPDHTSTVFNTMTHALLTNQQPVFTHMFNT